MKPLYRMVLTLTCATLSACASITATKVQYDAAETDGFIVYGAMPYLAVSAPVTLYENVSIVEKCPTVPDATEGQSDQLVEHNTSASASTPSPGPTPTGPIAPTGNTPPPTSSSGPTPKANNQSSASKASVEIVYLPDFCQAQAIKVQNILAVNKSSFKLKDGWMLTEVSADLNSVELATTLLEALKEIELGKLSAADPGDDEGEESDTSGLLPGSKPVPPRYRLVTKSILAPGVYEIFERKNCEIPEFTSAGLSGNISSSCELVR